VAHHGSKYSTSELFLENTKPKIAVISNGKDNSYGHPTPEVLQRLKKYDIKTLRTDQSGDIELASDGKNIYPK
jgi:competence protein ComEC